MATILPHAGGSTGRPTRADTIANIAATVARNVGDVTGESLG
jgi:hypothetical protein